MKRSTLLLTVLTVVLYFGGTVAFAQQQGGGSGHGGESGHVAMGSHGTTGGGGKSAGASSKQLNDVITNSNSKLARKLAAILPSGQKLTLASAASGFKNLGQFVAALHVYNNLDLATKNPPVSFTDFAKAARTHSLGAAIKQYDPTANSPVEAKKGTKQANDDVNKTGS